MSEQRGKIFQLSTRVVTESACTTETIFSADGETGIVRKKREEKKEGKKRVPFADFAFTAFVRGKDLKSRF